MKTKNEITGVIKYSVEYLETEISRGKYIQLFAVCYPQIFLLSSCW